MRRPAELTTIAALVAVAACAGQPPDPSERDGTAGSAVASSSTEDVENASAAAAPSASGAAPETRDESDGSAGSEEPEVLSPCSPVGGTTTRTVVAGDGPRPSDATLDAALRGPDSEEHIASLVAEGFSTTDARHEAYAQVVGGELFQQLAGLDGYVGGQVAQPSNGQPFEAWFTGAFPADAIDLEAYDLGSYGLEVTTGAPGHDEPVYESALRAVDDAGLVMVDGHGDARAGTIEIAVVAATADQVAAVESALDDPSRLCLVLARPDILCDDEVVAAAERASARQGEVITGTPSSEAEAEAISRSHLGLSVEESSAKADEEGRAWRVAAEDGVEFNLHMDGNPGRITVSTCQDVVVDAWVEVAEG